MNHHLETVKFLETIGGLFMQIRYTHVLSQDLRKIYLLLEKHLHNICNHLLQLHKCLFELNFIPTVGNWLMELLMKLVKAA